MSGGVLNYDDFKLFIIRDIDKLTECRRQNEKNATPKKYLHIFFSFILYLQKR